MTGSGRWWVAESEESSRNPASLRAYIHFADATVADAAERVGVVLEG